MTSKSKYKSTLIVWIGSDLGRLAEVRLWLDNAVRESGDGLGSQVTSATQNGSSFQMSITMSVMDYASLLAEVITNVENGTKPINKTVGGIC
tara:strand:+ start:2183 stop:2458 length:276 start_codon:yes stop_codon:yes gene_type:complete